jgi:hypothetical protein
VDRGRYLAVKVVLITTSSSSLSGSPLSVLNRAITAGTVSNAYADCDAPGTSTFNPSSGQMQVTYALDTYMSNPNCTSAAPPSLFGYQPSLHSDTFTIGFDVRSLITCVALNSYIVTPQVLQVTARDTMTFQGQLYPIGSYVDSRYPGMKPVPCLFPNGTDKPPICAMIIGSVYVVPVFNHGGRSFDVPEACNCTYENMTGSDVHTNAENYCKGKSLLLSLVTVLTFCMCVQATCSTS